MVLVIPQLDSLDVDQVTAIWFQSSGAMRAQLNALAALSITFFITTTIAFSLRAYTRAVMLRCFKLEDWAMLSAVICFCACSGGTAALAYKLLPVSEQLAQGMQPVSEGVSFLLVFILSMYSLAMIAFKISLGFLFHGLFVKQKTIQYLIYVSVALSICLGLLSIIWTLTHQCQLLTQFFPLLSQCTNASRNHLEWLSINAASALCIALTDLMFGTLAVVSIQRINAPFWSKVSAGGLLLLGSSGGIVSFVRFGMLFAIFPNTSQLGSAICNVIAAIIEPGLIITAACLSTTRPLLRRVVDHIHPPSAMESFDGKTNSSEEVEVKVNRFSFRTILQSTRKGAPIVFKLQPKQKVMVKEYFADADETTWSEDMQEEEDDHPHTPK